MKQSIKVTPEQKDALFRMKRPGEDYSDVIERLLRLIALYAKAEPLLRGAAGLEELRRLRETTAASEK